MLPLVLPKRRCGTPRPGLYAISESHPLGTLRKLTRIVAPLPAEIGNPRAIEVIDTAATLRAPAGLIHPDPYLMAMARFGKLPRHGIADLWGRKYYPTPGHVVEEILQKGISRRIAAIPDVSPPIPYFIMHMDAVITPAISWEEVATHIADATFNWSPQVEYPPFSDEKSWFYIEDQPWRDCDETSIGRVDDDDFSWHPHELLYEALRIVYKRNRAAHRALVEQCGFQLEEGIFALGWITSFAYCLGKDEGEVPDHLAVKGVVSALPEGDSRITEEMRHV